MQYTLNDEKEYLITAVYLKKRRDSFYENWNTDT